MQMLLTFPCSYCLGRLMPDAKMAISKERGSSKLVPHMMSNCLLQELSVRQQCSGMMLQFVLDYPLGAKRLQHHLQFLITNLAFEHESGRQAAVDLIKASSHTASGKSCNMSGCPGFITGHWCRTVKIESSPSVDRL